ncbi:hypothetical protein LJR225_005139 [Phenylobacterium sp. LjRoot225]|uniref:hypothetical protein n=1 Tax=Phenylobacterium sp. LjRoot225 TaxID=3342285 RepID=UPI003ED03182
MRLVLAASLAALTFGAATPQKAPPAEKPIRVAMMCTKTGEQVSGMNKICFYDCAGSAAAITIGAVQLCPLSINR